MVRLESRNTLGKSADNIIRITQISRVLLSDFQFEGSCFPALAHHFRWPIRPRQTSLGSLLNGPRYLFARGIAGLLERAFPCKTPAAEPPKHVYSAILYQRICILHRSEPSFMLVEMIEPHGGKVFDPACGSGGMFVQSAHFIENHRHGKSKMGIVASMFTGRKRHGNCQPCQDELRRERPAW